MILGPSGEAALLRVAGRALRQGPRGEHAVDLEAEVVVEAAGAVAMDDEAAASARRRAGATVRRAGATVRRAGAGLGRLREVALGAVAIERHPP